MTQLKVEVQPHPERPEVRIITPVGSVDTLSAAEFSKAVAKVVGEKKYDIVIDFKDVDYVSSIGWGTIVSHVKTIERYRGRIALSGLQPTVYEVYRQMGFDTLVGHFPDVESAVKIGLK